MSLYRTTTIKDGVQYTGVSRLNSKASNIYYNDSNLRQYSQRLSFKEAGGYYFNAVKDKGSSFALILSLIMILMIFSNINFSATTRFDTLVDNGGMTFDSMIHQINNTANVNLVERFNELFQNAPNITDDFEGDTSNVLRVLVSIFDGIINVVRAVVFVVDLLISIIQIIYSFVKILFLFFIA